MLHRHAHEARLTGRIVGHPPTLSGRLSSPSRSTVLVTLALVPFAFAPSQRKERRLCQQGLFYNARMVSYSRDAKGMVERLLDCGGVGGRSV